MAQLNVRVTIPDPRPSDVGCPIRLVVRDTSEIDALHPTVLESVAVVEDGDSFDIVIDVADGTFDDRHRYSMWAHVDHGGKGVMQPGDLIVTQNVPVSAADTKPGAPPIELGLTRI